MHGKSYVLGFTRPGELLGPRHHKLRSRSVNRGSWYCRFDWAQAMATGLALAAVDAYRRRGA